MAEKTDTSRSVVQVYVPAYQRDVWDEHAEKLDMSRSEFVKAMVQAGRRGFGADTADTERAERSDAGGTYTESLEDRVIDCLERESCLSWEELLREVTDDIEARLESTLQDLQNNGTIRYSGREGGYVLDDT